ncbi:hypothetical protein SAMN02799631_01218 [Methylobacterium sp. 174MFSha1.1]|uniref:hypothetical protein n=1 Tax=Methylobacterium sp. 174MFSha1.1 TaxID=1502749 RepID=UPI0008E3B38E|nr:hypothetical protein [Methylobacterium sp. 174MFSha1.1]SFU56087.1 hypothetical protein SAMN02799631_01218 [Methylobacterium sp. 174MFSha1.1]
MIALFRQAAPAPVGLSAAALLGAFESLGDNCEFGIAQRYAGADPLGLFRLSSAPIADLVHAVETRFAHYGGADDIEVRVGAGGYLFCHSRRYGFAYHTGDTAPRVKPADILAREIRRVDYLKERLLADLAAGDKILVRKGPPGESEGAVRRLFGALRAIGPVTLLRVCAAAEAPPGRVVWRGEGLMQGALPHFAPYAAATDADLPGWLAVCGRAYALRHSLVEPPALAPDGPPLFEAADTTRPALAVAAPEPGALAASYPVEGLRPNRLHVVAAEIRLPEDFSGTRAALAFVDAAPHARREADLTRRGSWQTIYGATRMRKRQSEATVGLMLAGPAGTAVEMRGWRVTEGCLPGVG